MTLEGEALVVHAIQNTYCELLWRGSDANVRQEQVVCPPALMTNKSAGCMLKAFENQFQVGGHLTPPSECAKFVGISSGSDVAAACR